MKCKHTRECVRAQKEYINILKVLHNSPCPFQIQTYERWAHSGKIPLTASFALLGVCLQFRCSCMFIDRDRRKRTPTVFLLLLLVLWFVYIWGDVHCVRHHIILVLFKRHHTGRDGYIVYRLFTTPLTPSSRRSTFKNKSLISNVMRNDFLAIDSTHNARVSSNFIVLLNIWARVKCEYTGEISELSCRRKSQ